MQSNSIFGDFFLSSEQKLEKELFNLKFTAKSLERESKRCEKNEAAQKTKLKQAIKKGNMEGAKIYAQVIDDVRIFFGLRTHPMPVFLDQSNPSHVLLVQSCA